MAKVIDCRQEHTGTPIRSIPPGTFYMRNGRLFLKTAFDSVADVVSGMRVAFNEEHEGLPVEVEVRIMRNWPSDITPTGEPQ